MKRNILIALIISSFFSCDKKSNKNTIESWKNEIMETELAFSKMAQEEGMDKAFLEFVADDGVLLRDDLLIKGKDSIQNYMNKRISKGLSWKPDFIDVSASGDLGYTYGEYIYTTKDSLGNIVKSKGVFHTVWKRQPDKTWKFVWD